MPRWILEGTIVPASEGGGCAACGSCLAIVLVCVVVGPCAIKMVSCVKNVPKELEKQVSEWEKEQEERQRQQHLAKQEEEAKQAAEEERRRKFKEVQEQVQKEVGKFLSATYNRQKPDRWERLDLGLSGYGTDKTVTFNLTSGKRVHLPPLEPALAPAGSEVVVKDDYPLAEFPGRELHVHYAGKKQWVGREKSFSVSTSQSISPLWLELLSTVRSSDLNKPEGSVCSLTLRYPSEEEKNRDEATRITLERVFRHDTDFGRPVKVVDLPPTEMKGVPVHWDLAVCCYPAYTDSLERWMEKSDLEVEYLHLFPPRLCVIKQPVVSAAPAPVAGPALRPVQPAQPINPEEFTLWRDDEQLLSPGRLNVSLEQMKEWSLHWRQARGLAEASWQNGGQLFIKVERRMDRHTTPPKPIGVTVRIILRVRLPRG